MEHDVAGGLVDRLHEILDRARRLKADLKRGQRPPLLAGKSLAMIFEKPSLRTRVTFEVGMTQLGGHVVYLTAGDVRVGARESVTDIARNLERWVDFIMARTFQHETLVQLAGPVEISIFRASNLVRFRFGRPLNRNQTSVCRPSRPADTCAASLSLPLPSVPFSLAAPLAAD